MIAGLSVFFKQNKMLMVTFIIQLIVAMSISACGTSDRARLKDSREAFLANNFTKAEADLSSPEVFENTQNRLLHFSRLSSIAFGEGLYEKAIFYLNKARDVSNSVRSGSGFSMLFGGDYRGNPIEYSFLHFYLVMANELLADAGKTPAWSTPDIKDEKGMILVQGQNFAERVYSAREIADLRQRARAELLAWDTHLQDLKRTFSGDSKTSNYYQEDLLARAVASYVHGAADTNSEKRMGELLAGDVLKILSKNIQNYPSFQSQESNIQSLAESLKKQAQKKGPHAKNPATFLLVEAGVSDPYKIKRFHLGLTTLFGQIQDPALRRMLEEIGIRVILQTAPEFGLVLVAGGVAGAVSGADEESDEAPRYFTDAVDRSFGFEIQFQSLRLPPADTKFKLFLDQNGKPEYEFDVPVLSPLQEEMAIDLKKREKAEMFARAVRMGLQYVAILIPAIKTYQDASREGNAFKKIAALAGYYLAKKAIDHANAPDLRSWDFLPKMIAGTVLTIPAGDYDAKIKVESAKGSAETVLGTLKVGSPDSLLLYRRLGVIPALQ